MPGEELTEYIPAAVGATGGLLGGSIAALFKNTGTKKTMMAMLGGLSFGAFLPPFLTSFWRIQWGVSGFIGLCSGIMIFGIIAGITKLGARFEKNPEVVLKRFGIDASEPKAPEKEAGT